MLYYVICYSLYDIGPAPAGHRKGRRRGRLAAGWLRQRHRRGNN